MKVDVPEYAFSGVVVIEGKYQLRNLFVLNAQSSNGVGFCVFEVTVNGDVTTDEVNSDAFEVDLSQYGFELGDEVEVRINHKDGCEPRILNPEALEPRPTFDVKDITVSGEGLLEWTTINEQGSLPFVVQQFKWNKWVTIGEVIGTGRMEGNRYSFQADAHSGTNTFRLAQRTNKGKGRFSEEISFESRDEAPILISTAKIDDNVTFSSQTHYEIFDEFGRLVKRGFDQNVNVSALNKGLYYINYDNRFGETFSKR